MLCMLCGNKAALPVDHGISNLCYTERQLVKLNRLILISHTPKCPNTPAAHTNLLAYLESIANIMHAIEKLAESRLVILRAEGRTCHLFPWIAPILADYPENCPIAMMKWVGALNARYDWMTCPESPAGPGTTISNDTSICQQWLLRRLGCGRLPNVWILQLPMQVVICTVQWMLTGWTSKSWAG